MCGIAGQWRIGQSGDSAALGASTQAMTAALAHRGPDAGDVWVEPASGIALGHRRLSILDLSSAGAQPMHSHCGRYVISFNGEIYNFAELRAELEAAGSAFHGHADTEVLLEACARWGVERVLRRANGMFAFALWDKAERVLHLACDSLGEKPLYYGWNGETLLFASELKALASLPGFRPAVDRDALALFMRHGYVPAPHSIYRNIRKLTPGNFVSFANPVRDQWPEPASFWRLRDSVTQGQGTPFTGTPEAGIDALEAALRQSIALRMVADVPLGAFLSGGIDSSTVSRRASLCSLSPAMGWRSDAGSTGPNKLKRPSQRAGDTARKPADIARLKAGGKPCWRRHKPAATV